jgi:RHS repeat-associated protein
MHLTNYHFYNTKKHLYSKPVKGLRGCGLGYRFSFNGKEKDNETYGEGNAYDFGARIYDPRLGRWLSLDPLQAKYPSLSPYNYCADNPIYFIDPDGKKILINYIDEKGESQSYEYGSKLTPPNNKFVTEAIKALDYVSHSKTAKKEINKAIKTDRILNIYEVIDDAEKQEGPNLLPYIPNKDGTDIEYDKEGKPIRPDLLFWSPYIKIEICDDKGNGTGKTLSSAMALFHEIKHFNGAVKNFLKLILRKKTPDSKYEDKEERKTTKTEAKVAKELGENTRENHRGLPHDSDGPTDNKSVKATIKPQRGGM